MTVLRKRRPMKKVFFFCLLIMLFGCAAKNFDMAEMESKLEGPVRYSSDDATVQEIEELKPQLQLPIVLAVAQPQDGNWTREEIEIIESWEPPLKEMGFVSQLVVLPNAYTGNCGFQNYYKCRFEAERKNAAQFRADALLVLNNMTSTHRYANFLSILDISIVGLWIVPAHHVEALTIFEGSLIDNRNKYLYAFARTFSEKKIIRPFIYADYDEVRETSRREALKSFGEKMLDDLKRNKVLQSEKN